MSKGSLYYIIEEDGRCRQIVNGVVTSLNKKTPLPYSPIGWEDILILWERNITRWAQVRNFSLPMGFVRDAALILRNDMYLGNIDRKLYLLIQKFVSTIDANFFRDRYEFLYKGELDFSTFEDVPGDMRVNMNIMEGGLSKLLKANENTQFLIPFDEDAINIRMDGINITGVYKWVIVEQTVGASGGLPTMVLVGNEQKAPGIAVFDINGGYTFSFASITADSTPYFLSSNISPTGGNVHFSGTINLSNPDSGFPSGTNLWVYNTIADSLTQIPLFVGPEAAQIPIDIDIPLVPGDRYFLQIDEYHYESNLTITLTSKFETTMIKGFRAVDVFKKLCEKLGIPASKAISNALEASGIILTSGDGIRGIQADDVGIKTSFNEFFKAYDVYHMLGCSVRDTINIEDRLSYFFTSNPVALGECSDFKVKTATDLMYSSIKVGHKEQDIEDVNGKYDFNGTMVFTTPIQRGGGKEMDLVSPYKAGPYEIESIRANLDGKDTTDSDRDNQVFAIAAIEGQSVYNTTVSFEALGNKLIFPNGIDLVAGQTISITGSTSNDRQYIIQSVTSLITENVAVLDVNLTNEASVNVSIEILSGLVYNLDRSITVTEGVPDPATIFNVPLSPARILKAHERWIRSFLYNYEPGELVFQQANRNADLVAGGIVEKANKPISAMGALVYLPYYFDFKTRVQSELVQTLDTTPDVAFMPTWLGDDYTGFLWKAGISPNSATPQAYKLLSGPENDLTRLIA